MPPSVASWRRPPVGSNAGPAMSLMLDDLQHPQRGHFAPSWAHASCVLGEEFVTAALEGAARSQAVARCHVVHIRMRERAWTSMDGFAKKMSFRLKNPTNFALLFSMLRSKLACSTKTLARRSSED
jgi:hypothetical protein